MSSTQFHTQATRLAPDELICHSFLRFLFESALKLQMFVFQLYEVEAVDQKVCVDESRFEPHTNYTVRVRSQPDQVDYKGVWSLWAPALHWRSGDIHSESVYRTLKQLHRNC